MVEISVVIPVYNVEKYIRKNIESLILQPIENAEFIYIIDGSTDNSEKILKEYQKTDSRIKIYNQENKGLSIARNVGIDKAVGEYLLFVDSDDYLQVGCLPSMLNLAKKNELDLLQGYFRDVDEQGNEIKEDYELKSDSKIYTGKEFLVKKKVKYTACLCLIRKKIVDNNGLRFAKGLYHEDMEFVPRMFYYAERVQIYNNAYYYRTVREGSITHTKNIKRCKDLLSIANMMKKFARQDVDEETKKGYFDEYIIWLYSSSVHLCIYQNISIRKFMSEVKVRNDILDGLKSSQQLKHKLQYVLLKYRVYELYQMLYKIKLHV